MTAITDTELASWLRRLSGGLWTPGSARADGDHALPGWFSSGVIRLDGHAGMLQLSNFGVMSADDPVAFEAALLRRSIGSTMLYSTLETPHTVTYAPSRRGEEDIVIIGLSTNGGQRLRTSSGVHLLSVGRMGFMSSLGASATEHLGLSETTGVVLPAAALPGYRHVLAAGAQLFPDTPLTRAASAALARMLYEWAQVGDADAGALAGTEATLLALARGLFRQFPGDGETDRIRTLREAATQIIERRHRDSGFGLDQLAAELHISRRQLFRFFAGADESAAALLLRLRLATAREELLAVPAQDLSTVAARSGFADAAALRAQFSRHVGGSPSAFRLAAQARSTPLAEAMLLSDEQSGL